MANIKLSIIVPVYNTENYLKRCLKSLLKQTLSAIEIIIVNDSSPDNSQQIIDEFVKAYPTKFFAHSKPNGGLSSARNYGLKYARGEYLAFVDSDDWVDSELYAKMYTQAISGQSEVVCCDFIAKYPDHDHLRRVKPIDNYGNRYLGNVIACNKIYQQAFWQKHKFQFRCGIFHEDIELVPRILSRAKQISFINCSYYYYEKRNLSSITNGDILHIRDFPVIFSSLDRWFNENLAKNDSDFKLFVADFAYLYLMLNPDWRAARAFFQAYPLYFDKALALNNKRHLILSLLKINFSLVHFLNRYLKKR